MDIGVEKPAIWVEPLTLPARPERTEPAPATPAPVKTPAAPEKVPA